MTIQAAFDFPLEIKSLKKTTEAKARRSGAFTDNMSLPVHRWFRYSAGFSAEWVEQSIAAQRFEAGDYIFDPFVGSGTTLLAAQRAGINSAGAEHHPFVFRIASAKLAWNQEESALLSAGSELLREAKATIQTVPASASKLLIQCYTEEALCRLEALRDTYWRRHSPSELIGELIWLAITSILRECSGVGTAQWQYVLPNKTNCASAMLGAFPNSRT